MVARKNSLERPKPRKKPREEPGYVGWPVLFWLCHDLIDPVDRERFSRDLIDPVDRERGLVMT